MLKKQLKETLTLAWPIIISQLMGVAMGTIDTIMVGRVGSRPLAAMAMANTLLYFSFVFCFGVLNALNPLISERFGAKKLEEIPSLVRQGFRLALLFAVMAIALFYFSKPVFIVMKQQIELIDLGRDYLSYVAWGMPQLFCFLVMRLFMESVSDPKPSMYASLLGIMLNIGFNYVLIYGHFGFPAMGVRGAGLATSIVHTAMFVFSLIYIQTSHKYKDLRVLNGPYSTDWVMIKKILAVGLPFGLSWTSEIVFFIFTSLLVGMLGHMELAAHHVAINFCATVFMFCAGIAMAVSVQIGQARGRGDWHLIRGHATLGYGLVVVIGLFFAMLIFSIPDAVAKIYTRDVDLVNMAKPLLLIGAFFLVTDGGQAMGMNSLKGMKDTRVPMINSIFSYWLVGVPICYVLCFHFNLRQEGVWWGMVVSLTVAAAMHAARFYWITRKRVA
ncbi:MAG: MATE family efflux transporter [Bdellovibrionota bacterium]